MLRKFLPWSRQILEEEVLKMEDYLHSVMSPVVPRREFVQGLRRGLVQNEATVHKKEKLGFLQSLFWIGAGFGSAVVLLTVGIRVIINLVKGSGLTRKSRQKDITSLH